MPAPSNEVLKVVEEPPCARVTLMVSGRSGVRREATDAFTEQSQAPMAGFIWIFGARHYARSRAVNLPFGDRFHLVKQGVYGRSRCRSCVATRTGRVDHKPPTEYESIGEMVALDTDLQRAAGGLPFDEPHLTDPSHGLARTGIGSNVTSPGSA